MNYKHVREPNIFINYSNIKTLYTHTHKILNSPLHYKTDWSQFMAKFTSWGFQYVHKNEMKKNLHCCPLEFNTNWTRDPVEGLQEGLCFVGVSTGVKHQPVIQSRSTDHV